MGVVSLPSERSARFGNPAWPGIRTANFAAADLSDKSQKQKIIDIFVNSVYVYDDRVVIFFNYKDGERCVDFSVLSDSENTEGAISSNEKKTNTHENECSPLIKSGDPYGN